MSLLLLLAVPWAPAGAAPLSVETTAVPASPAALDVAVLPGDSPSLALATGDQVVVVEPWSGAQLATVDQPAQALTIGGAEGEQLLVGCGSAGLWLATLAEGLPGAPALLDDAACAAVAAAEGDVLAWGEEGLRRFLHDGAGWTPLAVDDPGLVAPVVLAAGADDFTALSVGGSSLSQLGELGTSTWAMGAPVWDAAWASERWWVALPEQQAIRSTAGDLRPLDLSPTGLAAGDLDGDGLVDLVALDEDASVARLLTSTTTLRAEGVPGGAATTADLDGDGCEDLVSLDPDGAAWLSLVGGCEVHSDLDGDTWSIEAGDCDDDDPEAFPGATEYCDDIDQDCDGVIESARVSDLEVLDGEREGATTFLLSGTSDDCSPRDWTWEWRFEIVDTDDSGLAIACTPDGAWATCELLDDGILTVALTVRDHLAQPVHEETLSLTVAPAPPDLEWTADSPWAQGDLVQLEPGATVEAAVRATARGDDRPALALDGPAWATLTSEEGDGRVDGFLVLAVPAEAWAGTLTITATEDEGEQATVSVDLVVQAPAPPEQGGCACQGAGAPAVGLLLLAAPGAARRRRR